MPTDDVLAGLIRRAAERVETGIRRETPGLAPAAFRWIGSLSPSGSLADYFSHTSRFPMLALPWWATGPDRESRLDFHLDVVTSTMAGYCYVRLIDDLVDRQPGAMVELLPLTALLHTEFQSGYQRHFPPESPFWPVFRTAWLASADAMVASGTAAAESPEGLLERATATIGAVVIPLRAVTLASGRPERFDAWRQMVQELARIEQLIDDVVDWHADYERSLPNILLAEAVRRARPGEVVAAWVMREGYLWGLRAARERIDRALTGPAGALGSEPLVSFLSARAEAVSDLEAQTVKGLSQMAGLADVFGRIRA